jgi:hypothetical protein
LFVVGDSETEEVVCARWKTLQGAGQALRAFVKRNEKHNNPRY